ncbi:S1 family peptidase [Streptomyces sp. NPDC048242]|uniref:S1 family peptidase n=1 Tax=Streptomyces sp. NPDC048242 TaxID=3155026 RepID=UPI0034259FA8
MPKRKAAIAVGGVAALGAAALLLPNAMASQDKDATAAAGTAKTLKATDASTLSAQIQKRLGTAFAGSYYENGKQQLVVNVARGDQNAMAQAQQAGATVREVDNSTTELKAAAQTLKTKATIPGTAWAVDPRTNRVIVSADSTVTGAKWDRLESTVAGLGSNMATLRKSSGTFKTFVSGGDAIFSQVEGGNVRCSLGFNVTASDGSPAFLTAGHCGVAAKEWSDSQTGQPIATVDQATFPGEGDFSLVKYDDPATQAPSEVNAGNGQTVPIAQAVEATVGSTVFRMGSTTGLHNGQVTGLDATVNFQSETDPNGVDTVTGLIQTNVCAEPGDSGGSLFTQDGGAVGLTSGGSGDCTSGGETFFQPVTTALAATGATLGDGGQAGAGGEAGAGDQAGAGAGDQAGAGDEAGAGAGDQAGAGEQVGGDELGGAADPSAAAGDPAAGDQAAGDQGAAQNGTGQHHKSRHHSGGN